MAEKSLTPEQVLEALRNLAEARGKATGDSWSTLDARYDDGGGQFYVLSGDDESYVCEVCVSDAPEQSEANAAFIVAAANTISPALLAAVEGLVARIDELEVEKFESES